MPTMKIRRLANGTETWDKNGRCKTVEAQFWITGAPDKSSAIAEILSLAPESENGASLKEFRVGEFDKDKNLEITAVYERGSGSSSSDQREDNSPFFSFSAGGGTKHVTVGTLLKRRQGPNSGYLPDPGNLIGWNGDHSPQGFRVSGVDVPTASLKESWEKSMKVSSLTTAWRRKIANAVGKCNDAPFKGWDRGEVMLVDCTFSGSSKGSDKVKVKFDFAIRLNEENAEVDGVDIGAVEGWQYVWVISDPLVDINTDKVYRPQIIGIYVSQVVEYTNFNALGI
jgi:hypothetical protein